MLGLNKKLNSYCEEVYDYDRTPLHNAGIIPQAPPRALEVLVNFVAQEK